MNSNLDGRVAIVTGAAGGLGFAISQALACAGATVVMVDVRRKELESAASRIARIAEGRTFSVACDISENEDVCSAVEKAWSIRNRLDILINNAGIGPSLLEASTKSKSLRFWEADREVWQRTIAINVCGTYLISRGAVPYMLKGGWGRIVNISTSVVTMQRAATSPYGVSKAAIEAETIIWAKDLSGTGVSVNSLAPGGPVDTDFVTGPTRMAASEGSIVLLQPEIMVPPLLWLASRDSDGITGCRFVANRWDSSLEAPQAAMQARETVFSS
jgi:3-oxoacyl-[acyl-carrier protein] reductase